MQFSYRVYTIVLYISGKLRSSAFSRGVWNCDMLCMYTHIGIVNVNIQIIRVKLPIIILIYMISQFHIHI